MRSLYARLDRIEAQLPALPPSDCVSCGRPHVSTLAGWKAKAAGGACSCRACGCAQVIEDSAARRRAVELMLADFEAA